MGHLSKRWPLGRARPPGSSSGLQVYPCRKAREHFGREVPGEGQPLEQDDCGGDKSKATGEEEKLARRHYHCDFGLDWAGQQVMVSIKDYIFCISW